jgi:hypothetical protein
MKNIEEIYRLIDNSRKSYQKLISSADNPGTGK